jgi:hypothetical protein
MTKEVLMPCTSFTFRSLLIASVLGLVFAAASAPPLHASVEVNIGLFYDDLAPHGSWVDVEAYGRVWVPRVSVGWRPYTVGHWVWSDDDGWLWVSDEDYGWAVYHYGRWYYDASYGWAWVPGNEWGPAWVAFRTGGGYIGWAPLSPRVGWDVAVGFGIGAVQLDAFIEPNYYCFVPERAFIAGNLARAVVPVGRNTTIINVTNNVTNYTSVGGRVVNRSLSVDHIERAVGRPVPRARVVEVNSVSAAHHARMQGNEVRIFRPVVRGSRDQIAARGRATDIKGSSPTTQRTLDENRRKVGETQNQRADERRQTQARQNLDKQRVADERRQTQARQNLDKQRVADQKGMDKQLARDRTQYERQRQQVDKRQAQERTALEREHKKEIKNPPRELASGALDQRQAQEHKALDERHQRERQQIEAQHQRAVEARQVPAQQRTTEVRPAKRPQSPPPPKKDEQKSKPPRP